jgi:hypothetical protein
LQSDSAKKPVYKAAILNGQGIARFDGVNDFLADINPGALTAAHLFLVVKIDNDPPAAGKFGLWNLGSGSNTLYPKSDVNTQIRSTDARGASVDFSKSGIALNTWRVVEVISTSSEWTFSLDGTQIGSTSGAFSWTDSASFRLGSSNFSNTQLLDGDVAGMYIFSAKLTTERADIIDYLNDRFGLSSS